MSGLLKVYHDSFAGGLFYSTADELQVPLRRERRYWISFLSRHTKTAVAPILPKAYRLRARLKMRVGRAASADLDRHVADYWAEFEAVRFDAERRSFREQLRGLR
ncbi:MAG: hypothetical protein ACFB20_07880 [Opitutales bacterium]